MRKSRMNDARTSSPGPGARSRTGHRAQPEDGGQSRRSGAWNRPSEVRRARSRPVRRRVGRRPLRQTRSSGCAGVGGAKAGPTQRHQATLSRKSAGCHRGGLPVAAASPTTRLFRRTTAGFAADADGLSSRAELSRPPRRPSADGGWDATALAVARVRAGQAKSAVSCHRRWSQRSTDLDLLCISVYCTQLTTRCPAWPERAEAADGRGGGHAVSPRC
jgi:hypothetical protein